MLTGYDVTITQQSHYVFMVSGKDAEKLHKKLKGSPAARSTYITSEMDNGAFTLEKIAANATHTTVTEAPAAAAG